MANRLTFGVVISLLILAVILTACGNLSAGSNNTPADIPPTISIPKATVSPTEVSSETPLAEATPKPLPTETPVLSSEDAVSAPKPSSELKEGAILVFKISGGIVGFCDELAVNQEGHYTLIDCNRDNPIEGTLTQLDLDSLQTWHKNLTNFHLTFEDNPGGPDNLTTDLNFNGQGQIETDDREQQVIFDWVNGLMLRLRIQPEEIPPTPEPVATDPNGLCPDINRPALVTMSSDTPGLLVLIDPDTQATCEVGLTHPPFGRIATVAGNIYYPVFNDDTQTITIWKLDSTGEQTPLHFITVAMPEPMPFDFLLSDDGSKIAWGWTVIDFDVDPPLYRNNLRIANIDGANEVAILDQVENGESRFITPVRFAAEGKTLFYALQPDIGGPIFTGRYDTLYGVTSTDTSPQFLYGCPTDENPVCIGGITPDGNILTVIDPQKGTIQALNQNGGLINTLLLPATDYVGRTAFSLNGNLAFISAKLLQTSQEAPTLPNPGYISFIAPPYSGQPQTLFTDNSVGTLRGWLDENRLIFGSINQDGNISTAIVTLDGQVNELSPNVAVGVLR